MPNESEILHALQQLYNTTNGTRWTNNANWANESAICDMYGVTCSVDNRRSLNLTNNSLSGIVDSSFCNLLHGYFWEISLDHNNLYGSFPGCILTVLSQEHSSVDWECSFDDCLSYFNFNDNSFDGTLSCNNVTYV